MKNIMSMIAICLIINLSIYYIFDKSNDDTLDTEINQINRDTQKMRTRTLNIENNLFFIETEKCKELLSEKINIPYKDIFFDGIKYNEYGEAISLSLFVGGETNLKGNTYVIDLKTMIISRF